jgi:hypothetical protein
VHLIATTPARLRAASVLLVLAVLVVGTVAALTTSSRADAARAVGLHDAPAVAAAENLYRALADADASASTSHLRAGLEPPSLRRRYEDDLRAAGKHLALVASEADALHLGGAVQTISRRLPVYAGLVESARANNRQGFTVGAAYLRQASAMMRDDVLPAAATVFERSAARLDDEFSDGTKTSDRVFLIVAAAIAIALLLAVQVYLLRRMRRVVNLPLVFATTLVVALLVVVLVRFQTADAALVDAQHHGSDEVAVLSATRILALRAHNDDNLVLIERGGGAQYVDDYETISARIGDDNGHHGLLDRAGAIAGQQGSQRIAVLRSVFVKTIRAHAQVRALDDGGDYEGAVALAVSDEADAVADFDRLVASEIDLARAELDRHASEARGGFDGLSVGIPVLVIALVALVLIGLQRRIEEYR